MPANPFSQRLPARSGWMLIAPLVALAAGGCAEGRFWRLGRFSPRIVERWEQEEQIANSVFERKRQMSQMATDALAEGGEALNRTAHKLGETALTEPVLINRIEAIHELARLDCPTTWDALRRAITDPNPDVRLAVVQAWKAMSQEQAVAALSSIFAGDTNIDVRLAAIRMLGEFPGQASIDSLAAALNDADPAVQLRATQSLAKVTGQTLGPDVRAWSDYLNNDPDSARQASQKSDGGTIR